MAVGIVCAFLSNSWTSYSRTVYTLVRSDVYSDGRCLVNPNHCFSPDMSSQEKQLFIDFARKQMFSKHEWKIYNEEGRDEGIDPDDIETMFEFLDTIAEEAKNPTSLLRAIPIEEITDTNTNYLIFCDYPNLALPAEQLGGSYFSKHCEPADGETTVRIIALGVSKCFIVA